MKCVLVFAGIIAMLCQLSCSPDEEQTQLDNPTVSDSTGEFNAPRFVGNVVLENMYEEEVQKLTSKTPLEIITVLEGTSKVILQARFRSVRDNGPFGTPVYECELIKEEDDEEKPLPRNLDELIQQKEEDQTDAGLITITLEPSGFGGLPLPEGFPLNLPEAGEADEIPEGFPFPEGFPLPDDSEQSTVETELIIEGFIVTGSKEEQITIKVGDIGDGVLPIEGLEGAQQ